MLPKFDVAVSAADAGLTSPRKHPDMVPGAEFTGTAFLDDGDHLTAVQAHRDFQCLLLSGAAFDGIARNGAGHGADDGTDDGALAATDVTARNTADDRPGSAAGAGPGSFHGHFTDGFDDAHAHRHFLTGLVAGIDIAGFAGGAPGERRGGDQKDKQTLVHDHALPRRVAEGALVALGDLFPAGLMILAATVRDL